MGGTHRLDIRCPDCRTEIVVDSSTGEVLFHKAARREPAQGQDLSTLLDNLDQQKEQAEQTFEREVAAFQDRDRLMEEKFDEAMRQAEKDPDDAPPPRPFDLD